MANKILIKKSTVAGNIPTAAQLDVGELAVNTADGLLYTKHSDGSIVTLSGSAAADTPPAGGAGTYLLRTLVGSSTAGWTNFTDDISSYVSAGSNIRIAFQYKSGTSYTGDIQIDTISIYNDFIHNFDANTHSYEVAAATTTDIDYANLPPWSPMGTGYTTALFNRDSGGTSSSGTGLTTAHSGSWYIYAETSSTGYPNKYYWVRSPSITLTTNATALNYAVARYGSTIGTLKTYLIVE